MSCFPLSFSDLCPVTRDLARDLTRDLARDLARDLTKLVEL